MSLSWRTSPIAVRIGAIAALAGFFVSFTFTSSQTVNGHLTECNYTDYGALIVGAIAILAGVAGVFTGLARREDRAVILLASIAIDLVGVLHMMRGIGAIWGPCN